MSNDKNYINWSNINNYTKEFKEWIWKLFRKVHARIGHVEEDLIKAKRDLLVNYRIEQNSIIEDNLILYDLVELNKGEIHGSIVFDTSTSIRPIIWNDEIDM